MTWRPVVWKLTARRLTPSERALIDETQAAIARLLRGRLCVCGALVDDGIAHGVRCRRKS